MSEALQAISGRLRDAAHDAQSFPVALSSINAFLDASGVTLLSVDERLRHAPCSPDLSELMTDYFENGWYANDRREGCRPLLLQKGTAFDYEFLDREELEGGRGDYYTKFLSRHGRKWFAGVGANLQGDLWCLALQRTAEKGPFAKTDLPRLHAVRALLEETAAYARVVSHQWISGALTAFESEGSAAFFVDRDGLVMQMSSAARTLLGSRVASTRISVLSGARRCQTFGQVLRSLMTQSLLMPGATRRIDFQIGPKAFVLDLTCLVGVASLAFSRASAIAQIRPQLPDPGRILRQRYGLTNAEVKVAMALAAGQDVGTMANTFGVTSNTIRAHLKAIYGKTDTGTQAKLVGFVIRMWDYHIEL